MTVPAHKVAPPRVDKYDDGERYWGEPPPEPSPRCTWWVARIHAGWRPNGRTQAMGYYSAAFFYGVYIWEYLKVIAPLLSELACCESWAVACPVCGGEAVGPDRNWKPATQSCRDRGGNNQHDAHPERVAAWRSVQQGIRAFALLGQPWHQ